MKVTTKIYLKTFFMNAIAFVLLLAIWEYFDGEKINAGKLILQAAIFGAIMSYTTGSAQIRGLKQAKKENTGKEQ